MKLKEKITIDDIDGQKFKIRIVEPDMNKKAVVTHYLHNYHNGVKKHYEKSAKLYIKELVKYKCPEIKYDKVAEDSAIQNYYLKLTKFLFQHRIIIHLNSLISTTIPNAA